MSKPLNIFIEDSLMYAEEFFTDLGEITRFSGYKVTADDISNADVLLTRSTTKVDAALLSKADKLQFVGTATAGYDHIDGDYLEDRGIYWTAAPGCNADAVADYVLSSLLNLAEKYRFALIDKTIAVVGVGQVGKRINKRMSALGCNVILYDPPKAEAEANFESATFDDVLRADVITCHVPLTSGSHTTECMFDADAFSKLKSDCIFINACRGEIVDESALKNFLISNPDSKAVLDVFDNEPQIDMSLLPLLECATPHIAGHSIEGKARGTEILYQLFCQHFNLPKTLTLAQFLPEMRIAKMTLCDIDQLLLTRIVNLVYDIRDDSFWFKTNMEKDNSLFKYLRKNYRFRRELTSFDVTSTNETLSTLVTGLGFKQG